MCFNEGVKTFLSRVIARVFDPVVEIPVVLTLAIWFAVSGGLRWRFLLILLLVDAILPFLFMMIALAKGQIKTFDIRERRERIPLYLFTLLVHGVGILLACCMGKGDLAQILLVFWIIAAVFAAVTIFWKVSLHTGVNAVLAVFVNMLYGWQYWWLMLVIPVVAWARIHDKHHTPLQVLAGAVLGGGIAYVGLVLVGV